MLKRNIEKKNISDICKKIRYSNDSKIKKILVLPGTHDATEILNIIKKTTVSNNNKKYIISNFILRWI